MRLGGDQVNGEINDNDLERMRMIEETFGYSFSDKSWLVRALARAAFAKEQRDLGRECEDQETLATVGDAVLRAVLTELLFNSGYETSEEITNKRGELEEEGSLAKIGQSLGIGRFIILGRGEEKQKAREKASVLAETLEALIGAVYLDGGFDASKEVISKLFRIT